MSSARYFAENFTVDDLTSKVDYLGALDLHGPQFVNVIPGTSTGRGTFYPAEILERQTTNGISGRVGGPYPPPLFCL